MKRISCPPNCGACCKLADHIDELKHLATDKGWCRHLTLDHKCAIYDTRPEICVSNLVQKKRFFWMTWEEYLVLSMDACQAIRELIERMGRK